MIVENEKMLIRIRTIKSIIMCKKIQFLKMLTKIVRDFCETSFKELILGTPRAFSQTICI